MTLIQGIVDNAGIIIAQQGTFNVVSVAVVSHDERFTIEVPGADLSDAFILATPWSNIGDALAPSPIAAIVGFLQREHVMFIVKEPFGVSFRIETSRPIP